MTVERQCRKGPKEMRWSLDEGGTMDVFPCSTTGILKEISLKNKNKCH